MTEFTGNFKVTDAIGGRVGGYNFSPTLISPGPTRKQCPLYSVNSESSFLGRERSDHRSKGWSLRIFQTQQHDPHDSTRVVEGQPGRRGQTTRQSLFIARDRLRCEPGSKPVIVTAPFTGCEGHVPSRGDKGRRWKIFVGCPAFLSFWDQSPGRNASRSETVGNRLYRIHGQISLRHFTAEAQIQDRSRSKTGPNTAPAFSRVKCPFREAKGARKRSDRGGCPRGLHRHSRAGGNPGKNKARHLPPPVAQCKGAQATNPSAAMQAGDARVSTPFPARRVCPPRHLPACAGTTVVSKSSPRAGIAPTNG